MTERRHLESRPAKTGALGFPADEATDDVRAAGDGGEVHI
jgi:hypothetical protein